MPNIPRQYFDEELEMTAGGKMEFNKFKSLVIATSVLTGVVAVSTPSGFAYTPAKSLPTVISSSKEESNFKLSTNKYGVENVNSAEQNLHLQGNIFNSGMKFIKHEIKKEGSAVFIYVYGALITDSDFKEQEKEPTVDVDFKIPYTVPVIEPDFDIQYTIPDDVDAVYLCGKAKDDLKIVWEKKSLNEDSLVETKSDWPCLNINEYDVVNLSKTNQTLHLKIDFLKSEINFAEYKISKEDKTAFISIHGGYNANPNYEPPGDDFTVEYSVPDDVNTVYLRGKTKDDLKIVWENKQI